MRSASFRAFFLSPLTLALKLKLVQSLSFGTCVSSSAGVRGGKVICKGMDCNLFPKEDMPWHALTESHFNEYFLVHPYVLLFCNLGVNNENRT